MSKERYCARIFNTYGILVDYEGDIHKNRQNVEGPIDEPETFARWKNRVLGDVTDVVVYVPNEDIAGNTLISTIKERKINSNHIKKIFNYLNREKRKSVLIAIEETSNKYENFSIDALETVLSDLNEELQSSVNEYFESYIEKNINTSKGTEELVRDLVIVYNKAASDFRRLADLNG